MSNYVCQLKNGNMLVKANDNELVVMYTGYPYPSTPKNNACMLQDLFEDRLGVYKSEEFYLENYFKLNNFVANLSKDNRVVSFSIMELAEVLFGENYPRIAMSNCKRYKLFEFNNYVVIILKENDTDSVLASDDSIVIMSTANASDIDLLEPYFDIFEALCNVLLDRYAVSTSSISVITLFKIAIDVLHAGEIAYESYKVAGIERLLLFVINHCYMTNDGKYYLEDKLISSICSYIRSECNFLMLPMQLKHIMKFCGLDMLREFGLYITSHKHITSGVKTLFYCLDTKFSNSDMPDDVFTRLTNYSECIIESRLSDIYVRKLTENLVNDVDREKAIIIDISEHIKEGHLDDFYRNVKSFRDRLMEHTAIKLIWKNRISSDRDVCKPTKVTKNSIEWDIFSKFDIENEDLYKVCPIIFNMVDVSYLESYHLCAKIESGEGMAELLNCMFEDLNSSDLRGMVFNSIKYSSVKQSLIKYADETGAVGTSVDKPRYYKNLGELQNTLGDFNLFARLFCHRLNANIFKNYTYAGTLENGSIIEYQYSLFLDAHQISMSEKAFESFKGAVIIDFIAWLFDNIDLNGQRILLEAIDVRYIKSRNLILARYNSNIGRNR